MPDQHELQRIRNKLLIDETEELKENQSDQSQHESSGLILKEDCEHILYSMGVAHRSDQCMDLISSLIDATEIPLPNSSSDNSLPPSSPILSPSTSTETVVPPTPRNSIIDTTPNDVVTIAERFRKKLYEQNQLTKRKEPLQVQPPPEPPVISVSTPLSAPLFASFSFDSFPPPRSLSRSLSAAQTPPIPQSLICPLSHSLYIDPVLALDGFTYSRDTIEHWFESSSVSPSTGEYLPRLLIPNKQLSAECDQWRKQHVDLIDEAIRKGEWDDDEIRGMQTSTSYLAWPPRPIW